jgi:hypothetical protein
MKKIVGSNYLRRPELRTYLSKSNKNLAVITDYVAMEAYKANSPIELYKSMEILAEYPKQVVILKPTSIVCGLKSRTAGLQRRMICEEQTRDFHKYCSKLNEAKNGNTAMYSSLLEHHKVATEQMDRIRADGTKLIDGFKAVEKLYTDNELKIIRSNSKLTPTLKDKIIKNIIILSDHMFMSHPQVKKLPTSKELKNTFIFRFALCSYILLNKWISTGSQELTNLDSIKNDQVDLNFATYALYFDGLLTFDKKPLDVYNKAKTWLAEL